MPRSRLPRRVKAGRLRRSDPACAPCPCDTVATAGPFHTTMLDGEGDLIGRVLVERSSPLFGIVDRSTAIYRLWSFRSELLNTWLRNDLRNVWWTQVW